MWCILCRIQNQTWQSTGNEKAQAKQKQKRRRRRRRRSNWQRHSPSSICGLRNSRPRILPALQSGREFLARRSCVANYSALLVTIQLDLAHCNAASYADRHSRSQQQSRHLLLRQEVLPTSPLCNAGQCVCCLVAARRQERCDPTGWPARPDPARPGRSARHQIQIITVDEFLK